MHQEIYALFSRDQVIVVHFNNGEIVEGRYRHLCGSFMKLGHPDGSLFSFGFDLDVVAKITSQYGATVWKGPHYNLYFDCEGNRIIFQ